MIRKRSKVTDVGPADHDDDQAVETAAETETVPDDLTAAAEQFRQAAHERRERASRARGESAARVSAVEQENARRLAEVKAADLATAADATADERTAAQLEERARYLTHAVAEHTQASEQLQLATDLEAERDRLTEQDAELTAKLAELTAARDRMAGQLAAARQDADLNAARAAVKELRAQIATDEDIAAGLTSDQVAVRTRLAAIGDGSTNFPGALLKALNAAKAHTARARAAINAAYPDSPQAVADRAVAELRAIVEGNLERIAEERRQPPRPPQQVVMNRR